MKKLALALISVSLLLAIAIVPALAAKSPVSIGIVDEISVLDEKGKDVSGYAISPVSPQQEAKFDAADLKTLLGDNCPGTPIVLPIANVASNAPQTGNTLEVIFGIDGVTPDFQATMLVMDRDGNIKSYPVKAANGSISVTIPADSLKNAFALVLNADASDDFLGANFENIDPQIFSPNTLDNTFVALASFAAVICLAGAVVAAKKAKEN